MTVQTIPPTPDAPSGVGGKLNEMQSMALRWRANGYHVVTLIHGEKGAKYAEWQNVIATEESIIRDFAQKSNIGLLHGVVAVDGSALITFDIDQNDPELIDYVERHTGSVSLKKFGQKGLSISVRSVGGIRSQAIRAFDGSKYHPAIDLLAVGKQTVVPPSIHPKTKLPYRWLSYFTPDNTKFDELSLIDQTVIDKVRAFCQNRENPVASLDFMEWKGLGGGGDTHDTCVAAVACMVSWGWTDEEIHREIHLTKKAACERAGEVYDWPQERKVTQEWIDSARAKGFDQPKKKGKPSHGDLATLVLSKHGAIIKRDKTRRDWLVYNGKHWVDGATEEVKTLIRRSLAEDQVFRSVIDGVEAVMRWDASLGVLICAEK